MPRRTPSGRTHHHLRRREHLLDRGRDRAQPASCCAHVGGGGPARREVGRNAVRLRPAPSGRGRHGRGADPLLPRQPAALRGPQDRRIRDAADHFDGEGAEVHAARASGGPVSTAFLRPPLDYPPVPYDRLLSHGAERHPENVAVVFRDASLTYRELDALTNRFTRALARLGVGKGDRVCLLTTNCPEYVIAFYAIARIGAVASPTNPSYREREIEYQLNDTEAVAIVAHADLLPLVDAVRARATCLRHVIVIGPGRPQASLVRGFTELIADEAATPPGPLDIREDELVALPYSSGTTGFPKGVMISHRNLVTNNIQFVACIRLRESDRLMIFLPFYHIYGTMLMGAAIHAGATCVLMERFEPVECLQLVQRHRVTLFFVVPPVLLMLSNWPDLAQYDLSSLRVTMVGAAPVAPELSRRFRQLTGVPVLQGVRHDRGIAAHAHKPRPRRAPQRRRLGRPRGPRYPAPGGRHRDRRARARARRDRRDLHPGSADHAGLLEGPRGDGGGASRGLVLQRGHRVRRRARLSLHP